MSSSLVHPSHSMEMRNKGSAKGGGDKIVRRELASVFTNGTVVDEAFLAGDDASHCVAIKVRTAWSASPPIRASDPCIFTSGML
jgi:DNA mismatch repair ATPase MutS